MAAPAPLQPHLRSLYRRLLRELPSRAKTHTILSNPSPIQKHIRSSFASPASKGRFIEARLEEAEQYVQYIRAQRMYATLIERYNPGMNMGEEERVRLTARRDGIWEEQ
ncbi:hypothetical protein B0A49_07485 [Cryomyces minteri]|uniref:ATP synthase assembly factor FMC1, mitochondrial n=1 Tax=Cryomyces minteri TaxID=331657 RepID=A0A4U0XQ83_9PEZI|nr:hypothetical protein B0A49_07485 [Cryomyces minteri]